jgi:hypothetical protein
MGAGRGVLELGIPAVKVNRGHPWDAFTISI